MIIGFLCTDLNTLSLFKKTVQEYPLHGYVFYCDTSGSTFDAGTAFLIEKGCEVIVVEDESQILKVQSVESVHSVFASSTLDAFLESKEHMHEQIQSTIRIIHLTEHTKETDEKIRSVLGGVFIED